MPEPRPLNPGDPTHIGAYRIVGRLGQGGQGTVYLGESESGPVAVKILHERHAADEDARERLLREVEAARKVPAFCTARVLEVGLFGDLPYVVSEYIDGESLDRRVKTRGPLDPGALERLAIGTATALVAIHSAGIVHRDFKPANVLLSSDGPRVVDFGIARAIDLVTSSVSVAGTPPYMSPEQFSGEGIGTASDIFSWGGTMIFAATGRLPFGEGSMFAIVNRVLHQEPDLSGLPESLLPIVAACMAKNPDDRPTARDLLMRLITGSAAVPAAPASENELLETATARIRGAAPPLAPALLAPPLAGAGAQGTAPTVVDPSAAPPGAAAAPPAAGPQPPAWPSPGVPGAPQPTVANAAPAGTAPGAPPGWPQAGVSGGAPPVAAPGAAPGTSAGWPPAGGAGGGTPPGARPAGTAPPAAPPVTRPSDGLTPGRRAFLIAVGLLVPAAGAGAIMYADRLFGPGTADPAASPSGDAASRAGGGTPSPAGSATGTAAPSPASSGETAVAGGGDGATQGPGGSPEPTPSTGATGGFTLGRQLLLPHDAQVMSVAITPDGKTVVTGDWNGRIHVWDTVTGRLRYRLNDRGSYIDDLAISPDGRLVVTVGGVEDTKIRMWDLTTRNARGGRTIKGAIFAEFSPDGTAFVTGSGYEWANLWRTSDRRQVGSSMRNGVLAKGAAFSPDGRVLAVASWDRTVRLWKPSNGSAMGTLTGHREEVNSVVFVGPRLLASAGYDQVVRFWDVDARKADGGTLKGPVSQINSIAYSPAGVLAAGEDKGLVWLWNPATRRPLVEEPLVAPGQVRKVRFSPDGRVLAIAGGTAVQVWEIASAGG